MIQGIDKTKESSFRTGRDKSIVPEQLSRLTKLSLLATQVDTFGNKTIKSGCRLT